MDGAPEPYVDFQHANGKVYRRCMVSDECRENNVAYERRGDMVNHLFDVHSLRCNIPSRKVGRKSALATQSVVNSARHEKQSRSRFGDAEYKFRRNKKNHEQAFRRAKQWMDMSEAEKGEKGPLEVYLQNLVDKEMESYMSTKDDRMVRILEKIGKGYDTSRRVPKNNIQAQERKNDSLEEGPIRDSTPEHLIGRDEHGPLLAPTKQDKRKRGDEETLGKRSLHLESDDEPISNLVRKGKLPKIRFRVGSSSHVNISDSPCLPTIMPITLQISNNGVQFESSKYAEDVEGRRERLKSGASFHFKSQAFNLLSEVDIGVLDGISSEKASTKIMNLFMMWLENTLPKEVLDRVYFVDSLWYDFVTSHHEDTTSIHNFFGYIDMAKHMFLFLPIVHKDHWFLFVVYNKNIKKLVRLPWESHGVLYFNSMARTSPEMYLPIVQRALEIISVNCSNETLRDFMQAPRAKLDPLEMPEIPRQPNTTDCGYYVMTYIQRLIDGAYGKRSKSWLTKTWFKHEDVIGLKDAFFNWSKSALELEEK